MSLTTSLSKHNPSLHHSLRRHAQSSSLSTIGQSAAEDEDGAAAADEDLAAGAGAAEAEAASVLRRCDCSVPWPTSFGVSDCPEEV